MRRIARVDENQSAIVDALRSMGGTVAITSMVGQGFPDAVLGAYGQTMLLEIKDGAKSPSRRRLTAAQQPFHASWKGSPIVVVDSVNAAIILMNRLRTGSRAPNALPVLLSTPSQYHTPRKDK